MPYFYVSSIHKDNTISNENIKSQKNICFNLMNLVISWRGSQITVGMNVGIVIRDAIQHHFYFGSSKYAVTSNGRRADPTASSSSCPSRETLPLRPSTNQHLTTQQQLFVVDVLAGFDCFGGSPVLLQCILRLAIDACRNACMS